MHTWNRDETVDVGTSNKDLIRSNILPILQVIYKRETQKVPELGNGSSVKKYVQQILSMRIPTGLTCDVLTEVELNGNDSFETEL
jgi:hypothetical protein